MLFKCSGHVERTNDRDYEIEERYAIFAISWLCAFANEAI